MANETLKKAAKDSGVHQWQIAARLGISEPTLTRWLRFPLPEEKERKIKEAIQALEEEVS